LHSYVLKTVLLFVLIIKVDKLEGTVCHRQPVETSNLGVE